MEIILAFHDIRSTYNVGAILRTAEGFGVKKAIFSGYTPTPHDQNLLPHLRAKLDKEIAKTALGAENLISIYPSSDIKSELKNYQKQGYQIVGLENNLQNPKLIQITDPKIKSKLRDKIVLLLGEEVHGIDYSLHDIIDLFLEIPMHGQKESFNVSVAAGIALYGIIYS